MKKFNKMSRGEQAYEMNEVISSLNDERGYGFDWIELWPDGATLEEARKYFDNCSDKDWKDFVKLFRTKVEMYGCVYGRSIQEEDLDGLYVPKNEDPYDEADERGGGFYFPLRKKDDPETMERIARAREVLTFFGYPLTDALPTSNDNEESTDDDKKLIIIVFYIDWKKWREQKAAAFIKESVEWLLQQDCGCCTIRFSKSTQLAVGWENGFDPKDPSIIHSKSEPEWGICVGIKALEGDDMMTDFEWLTTPYAVDGDNIGEEFSNLEVSLSPEFDYEKDAEYLIREYNDLLKEYKVRRDGKCFHKTL